MRYERWSRYADTDTNFLSDSCTPLHERFEVTLAKDLEIFAVDFDLVRSDFKLKPSTQIASAVPLCMVKPDDSPFLFLCLECYFVDTAQEQY